MKVAIDAINLRADRRGMGRIVRTVIAALARRSDLAVTLLVRDANLALRTELQAIAGGAVTVEALGAARRRGRFDVVWYPWNAMRFRSAAPALVTINDDFAFRYPARGPVARWREQRPILRAAKRAARIATISQWSRDMIADRFAVDRHRIDVVPLAPDPFFMPAAEPSPVDAPIVLFVGGGEERKHLLGFCDAFARAFPAREFTLVVAGAISAREAQRLRRPDLAAVHLEPDDDTLRALYRNARAVAIPSLAEGYGLVAIEAQACGAAVITANGSALPEAGGDAAYYVEPGNRDAWAAALREVVLDDRINAGLRADAVARWAGADRNVTAPAFAELLARLVDQGA